MPQRKPLGQRKPLRPRRPLRPTRPVEATVDESGLGWVDAGKGYQLTLDGGKLAAKNPAGKRLSSVPKEIKDGDTADQLEALRDWLVEHDRECIATVEQWDAALARGARAPCSKQYGRIRRGASRSRTRWSSQ